MTLPIGLRIGADIGGTRIKAVALDAEGDVVERTVVPTDATGGTDATIARLAVAIDYVAGEHGATPNQHSIGVAVPGNVDADRGVVVYAPALGAAWAGFPLAEHLCSLATARGTSIMLINDVQAMLLAELGVGAAAGHRDVLAVAIGTGVGGAIAIDGRLHRGVDATAGSIGHTTVEPDGIECVCGNQGCLERYASGPVIATNAGTDDALAAARAAAAGDDRSLEAFERAGRYLGLAVSNVCTMLTPTMIVIGGGVAAAGDLLLQPLRDELARRTRVVSIHATRVCPAALGDFAGAVGAALATTPRAPTHPTPP